ncbi:hypothetical protein SEVIR_9G391750v4 [Setaria viridis]
MSKCNPTKTPLEVGMKLSKKDAGESVDAKKYRSIIGSLRYLVNTRPDLAHSVGLVSRYMEAPGMQHWKAVKHILKYIKGTLGHGCHYKRNQSQVTDLIGYSDSDFAGDVDDRKSTPGMVFFLGTSLITWMSQKQRIVALSSCEAEYIATTGATCQGVWLSHLLAELTAKELAIVKLKVDNMSAIALSKNPVHHDRSKHIDVKFHYIRECIDRGIGEVDHVETAEQLADVLTKALGRVKFVEMKNKLGVGSVQRI